MAAGLGAMRLEPRAFWSMTLKEFEAAVRWLQGASGREPPPSMQDVAALMQRFPD